MARLTIISIIFAAPFLPTAFCRPLEVLNDVVPEQNSQWASSPTNYLIDSPAREPTPITTGPTTACSPPLGSLWYPEGCRPNDPSCCHPYPMSWHCPSGIYPPLPTPPYPLRHPGSPTATGILPLVPIGGPRPTGTVPILPSATGLSQREVDELAVQKRRAFEGPRHHHFLHYWPHYAAVPGQHSEWTSNGQAFPHVAGTAHPHGTGVGVGPNALTPTGTAPATVMPFATGHHTTNTASTLTLPIESGIAVDV